MEASKIVNNDFGNNRFVEYTNSLYYMLNQSKVQKEIVEEQSTYNTKQMYVQSPMTTRNEIRGYLEQSKRLMNVNLKLQSKDELSSSSSNDVNHSKSDIVNISDVINEEITNAKEDNMSRITTDAILGGLGIGLGVVQRVFNPVPSIKPLIIPSIDDIKRFFLRKYESLHYNPIHFMNDNCVIELARLLQVYHDHKDTIQISRTDQLTTQMTYYPCIRYNRSASSTRCTFFSLHGRKYKNILCAECQSEKSIDMRKRKRVTLTPTRSRPFDKLSPEEKVEAYDNRNKKYKSIALKYQRLVTKLSNSPEDLLTTEGTPALDLLRNTCQYISKNWKYSKNEITKLMMTLDLGEKGKQSVDDNEREECAEYLCENIVNMKKKLDGNPQGVRFSAHTINIAMSLYLRSKKGYDDMRDSGLLCLPSPQLLNKKTSKYRVNPGGDPSIYLMLQDEIFASEEKIVGHLMFDEVKLKNGISFNCKSKEIVGFIPEEINTQKMLENILNINKKKKYGELLSVYANQWRFRSTKGIVHNADFYYNKGSLDGNELIRQYIDVVSCYELIGIKIYGMVSDGGGGNTKFFKLISEYQPLQGIWINEKCLRTLNPVDPCRYIYIWSCSTHSLKALRNTLYRSQPNQSRSLKYDDCSFGWKDMESIYLRDLGRMSNNVGPRTNIVKHAIYLDKYTMMNAGYAKQVFSDKTICESISYLSMMLQAKTSTDTVYESQWHKFTHHLNQLEKSVEKKTARTIKSSLALLHYQISVHGIYIERLMNPKWRLTGGNIYREESILNKIVSYFEIWFQQRGDMKIRDELNESEVDKYFISLITYNNMKTLVTGFLQYACCIIENDNETIYIPALHSNQSSLESLFYRIRFMGKDKTHLYAGGILQQNVFNQISSIKKLRGNTAYPLSNVSVEVNVKQSKKKKYVLM